MTLKKNNSPLSFPTKDQKETIIHDSRKERKENNRFPRQGAEAIIYLKNNKILKTRLKKSYRHPKLDKKIRTRRTKAETKILEKAGKIIPVPKIIKSNQKNSEIEMEFIQGKKLSEYLDFFSLKKQEKIMFQIGQSLFKIHNIGIIHGDLTTSNMILKKDKIYFIDFGLSFLNGKYEDKGVDLYLLKQALNAKHFRNFKTLFNQFEIGYRSIKKKEAQKVFDRLKAIEKRRRYKN
ncbi:MAG: KEOPS complex kinase/ATPase Bud32 [Nanoarchaeota archaeon]|nr:KEOPS complex kinase/ATPase Bud32 [Nanoarchaeota archaeon]